MQPVQIATLCQDVEHAAVQVRTTIGERTPMIDVLNRFWLLHDTLNRLVDEVSNGAREDQARRVISTVVSALSSPAARARESVAAVRDLSEKINSLLMMLEHLTCSPGPS